ncbi:hypothetical protein [Cystobacter fuscus]|uniref:hypothetical protein n=1 Tax=Cystobacter fuscus TaxID=43 RepID=UPI002B2A9D77|nr:hypothetical protein F0U63_10165 [Cystobacter fuscus]
MRIAVTGTHWVGKSTLLEELGERLTEYRVVDEPYHLLEEEWLARVRATLQTLDLVVFVPIEERDRIQLPAHEEPRLRAEVDEKLAWMLLDDPFELGVEVLPVHGSRTARVTQVLERLGRSVAP